MKLLKIALLSIALSAIMACNKNNHIDSLSPNTTETMFVETIGDVDYEMITNSIGEQEIRYLKNGMKEVMENFHLEYPKSVVYIDMTTNKKAITIAVDDRSNLLPPKIVEDNSQEEARERNSCRYEVTFFDDTNFSDRFLRIKSSSIFFADSDLKNTYSTSPRKRGFNDKTSSIKITPPCCSCFNTSSEPVTLVLELFDDKNFKDRRIVAHILNPTEVPTLPNFNDKLSSFKIKLQ